MRPQAEATEMPGPPFSVRLSGLLMSIMGLLFLIISLGPAILGFFSGPHIVVPGLLGCATGVWGMSLASGLKDRRRNSRFHVFCWAFAVELATVIQLILVTMEGDPTLVVAIVVSTFAFLASLSIQVAILTKSSSVWFNSSNESGTM